MKYMLRVTVAVLLTAFSVHSASAQVSALTNADVIRYVTTMHMPDQVTINLINEATVAKATQFDLSPAGVADLAAHGVSPAVIAAMRQPSTPTPTPIPTPTPTPTPTPPPWTPAEAAINRSKFEKVHAAGQAVVDALGLEGLVGQMEQVKTTREFTTEASLASEKATTKAEVDLAFKYGNAAWGFATSLSSDMLDLRLRLVNSASLALTKKMRDEAWETLRAADKIYLAK
jgi:hypothetical protein